MRTLKTTARRQTYLTDTMVKRLGLITGQTYKVVKLGGKNTLLPVAMCSPKEMEQWDKECEDAMAAYRKGENKAYTDINQMFYDIEHS